ncbi:MAG: mechanosensitive ion channel [Burkholderiaceae bacterium]|nr:MAG: mechanosensitive ion channel [Burkholderiaceae bacterium]
MSKPNSALMELWDDVQQPDIVWQLATLLLCLLLAWGLSALLRRWLKAHPTTTHSVVLQTGVGGLRLLLFPITAWLSVVAGREILSNWMHVNLLHVAVALLFSFVLVRLVVYLIRNVITHGGWLAGFEKLLTLLIWSGLALYITGLDEPLLQLLEHTTLPIGKSKLSVLLILQGTLSVVVTLMVTLWLSALLETRLLGAATLDANLRLVTARVIRAALLLIGILFALSLVGFDLTLLSVFGGALGVGLGFGLQKVASNYVSGFIILVDHSLRIGDLIEVDKYRGTVRQINTRYTVIRALDGTEAIVPNEMLIANPVLNLSYTDHQVRLTTHVSVGYATDIEALLPRLCALASAHPRVLEEPVPSAALLKFGTDGIDLELGFWIDDPTEGTSNVRSDINREILKLFRAEGIEIPYPQREVRVIGAGGLSQNPAQGIE